MLARLQAAEMSHPLIGGMLDDVRIGLKGLDGQQPVMMRRLILRRNTEPDTIRVEIFWHNVRSCEAA